MQRKLSFLFFSVSSCLLQLETKMFPFLMLNLEGSRILLMVLTAMKTSSPSLFQTCLRSTSWKVLRQYEPRLSVTLSVRLHTQQQQGYGLTPP